MQNPGSSVTTDLALVDKFLPIAPFNENRAIFPPGKKYDTPDFVTTVLSMREKLYELQGDFRDVEEPTQDKDILKRWKASNNIIQAYCTLRNETKQKICTLQSEKSVLCEVKNLYFGKWKICTLRSEISVPRLLSSCSLTYRYNCDRKLAVAGRSTFARCFGCWFWCHSWAVYKTGCYPHPQVQ